MKLKNIGGFSSVEDFVGNKISYLNDDACSFRTLYPLMFSEEENIMYEKSAGYRIEKTTYGKCRRETENMAAVLFDRLQGIDAGGNIGIYMENSLEFIKVLWSVLKCGFCPVLMNLRLDDDTLENIIVDAKIKAVISNGKKFSVKTVDAASLNEPCGKTVDREYGKYIFVMSSGTSNSVKVCAYSAKAFCGQIKASFGIINESRKIQTHYEGELKLLTFLPFYHIFGLVAVYIWFAFFSRTFVELPDLSPATLLNTVRRHKVTHIFAVPLFWNKIYSKAVKSISERGEKTERKFYKGLALSDKLMRFPVLYNAFSKLAFKEVRENLFGESIVFMITGGSEIKPETLRFFNAIGYRLANGYGMTEIGITSVELSDDPKVICSASVGHPITGVEYTLAENGELLVRGLCTSDFIIEHGIKTENNGWLSTGDNATFSDGRYYICGRRDDTVISPTGENLNPNLIEPRFHGIKGLSEACLIGVKNGTETEAVLLLETEKYIGENAFARLKDTVKKRLDEINKTAEIRAVYTKSRLMTDDEIKLNRRNAAVRFTNGEIVPFDIGSDTARTLSDDVYEKLCEMFSSVLSKPAKEIHESYDFFADGGGTSLDYFTLISEISDEFSVSIIKDSENTLSKISEIHDYIVRKHAE